MIQPSTDYALIATNKLGTQTGGVIITKGSAKYIRRIMKANRKTSPATKWEIWLTSKGVGELVS